MIFPVDYWDAQDSVAVGSSGLQQVVARSADTVAASSLRIGGFIPTTSVDFPGHLAAVIFTQGCPWRCGYCHNAHLAAQPLNTPYKSWDSIYALLQQRQHLLDGVVFSGGEPTIQKGLISATNALTNLGYSIALHTGGPEPDMFKKTLHFVDWIGFDIKAMPENYPAITGVVDSGRKAWQSLQMLLEAGISYEVRTTVHWAQFTPQSLLQLARSLANLGVEKYVVQLARSENMLNPLLGKSITPEGTGELWAELRSLFRRFECRHG